MTELWHRQPGETKKAFDAFRVYRDMGDERTLEKVAAALRKSAGLIYRWSGRYGWVNRIAAYENHLDQIRLEKNRKAILEMDERQAALGKLLQDVGGTVVNQVAHEINRLLMQKAKPGSDRDKIDAAIAELVKKINLATANNLIVNGTRVERVARGKPSEVVEQQNGSVSDLDPETVDRLTKAMELKSQGNIREEVAQKIYDEFMGGGSAESEDVAD